MNIKKPTRLWLNILPRHLRIRAMWNCRQYRGGSKGWWSVLDVTAESLKDALYGMFLLGHSPQGREYWKAVIGVYSGKGIINIIRVAIHESDTAYTNKLTDDEVDSLAECIYNKLNGCTID